MIRFLLVFGVGALAFYFIQRAIRHHFSLPSDGKKTLSKPKENQEEEMFQDPQCGVFVSQKEAIQLKWDGNTHYFCSQRCANEWQMNQFK